MLIEQKNDRPKAQRDFGETLTPKQAASILSGTTSTVVRFRGLLHAELNDPETPRVHIRPVIHEGDSGRNVCRYDKLDVYRLRNLCVAINGLVPKTTFMTAPSDDSFLQIYEGTSSFYDVAKVRFAGMLKERYEEADALFGVG